MPFGVPPPANVVMMPVAASMRRTTLFCESAMNRFPTLSRASPNGWRNVAFTDVRRGVDLQHLPGQAHGDEEVPGAVEGDPTGAAGQDVGYQLTVERPAPGVRDDRLGRCGRSAERDDE